MRGKKNTDTLWTMNTFLQVSFSCLEKIYACIKCTVWKVIICNIKQKWELFCLFCLRREIIKWRYFCHYGCIQCLNCVELHSKYCVLNTRRLHPFGTVQLCFIVAFKSSVIELEITPHTHTHTQSNYRLGDPASFC